MNLKASFIIVYNRCHRHSNSPISTTSIMEEKDYSSSIKVWDKDAQIALTLYVENEEIVCLTIQGSF